MSPLATRNGIKNLKRILENKAGDNEAQIIFQIQTLLVTSTVLSERDRHSILKELSEGKSFEESKKDFDTIKQAFKTYKKNTDEYKLVSNMENLMTGILYGKSQENVVGKAVDTLYNDMFSKYRSNKYQISNEIKQAVKLTAATQIAKSINTQLRSQKSFMDAQIVYNGTKFELLYNPKSHHISFQGPHNLYTTEDVDQFIKDHPELKKTEHYKNVQTFRENLEKGQNIFDQHQAFLQAQLDKLNMALDESVDKAAKQAQTPETRKSVHRREAKMICGIVGSILIGIALFATAIAIGVLLPPIGAGLTVGLISAGFLGGFGSIFGGAIGFGMGLASVKNKAPIDEVIDFFDKASSSSREIVGSFKEMREEFEGRKSATQPETRQLVGTHTASLQNSTTQLPDTTLVESTISEMIKAMSGIKTAIENSESVPEAQAKKAPHSPTLKTMFDLVIDELKNTAKMVQENTAAAASISITVSQNIESAQAR